MKILALISLLLTGCISRQAGPYIGEPRNEKIIQEILRGMPDSLAPTGYPDGYRPAPDLEYPDDLEWEDVPDYVKRHTS